jgi:protein SCO1/2
MSPVYTEPVLRRLIALTLLAVVALAGRHSGSKASPQKSASQPVKVYKLRGKVIATDAAKGEVTLDQAAIPGYMEAMTMPYKLKDASRLGELHPGDRITADVLVAPAPNADPLLDHLVVVAQVRPTASK